MKIFWVVAGFLSALSVTQVKAQEENPPEKITLQLEAQAERNDAEPEDDSYELDLDEFRRHPLNLNSASEQDLTRLRLLTVLQTKNFISYRELLGALLSIHECQAIPGWDLETIHRILPYILVGRDESVYSALKERWQGGDAAFLIRIARVLEKSKGFQKPLHPESSYYEGSADKIFIRYLYNYKQLLSYGFTGEKDAGEPFFKGAQKYGFDFYSFHFFLQRVGLIKALAIGDFTINFGQGLIQWQAASFTKTSQVLAVKREAARLRPYHSAGEFNFHRGVGISLEKRNWQSTLFFSIKNISTNAEPDSSGREELFTSFQNSGYHRTPNEIADRNNSQQISAGASLHYTAGNFMIGLNAIQFHFSKAFKKPDLPYNLFALKGKQLGDYSIDYNYTYANIHLFGELATDQWLHVALLQGALVSMGEKLDMSFVYRNISTAFKSLYSDAFTENSIPNNENGFYTGMYFRPGRGWQLNFYSDFFSFPWLKYRVDEPSRGRDLLFQVIYQPNKIWQLLTLYKSEQKASNGEIQSSGTHALSTPVKQRWRISTDYELSKAVQINNRMEFVWYRFGDAFVRKGFLGLAGVAFRLRKFSGNFNLCVFETDDYNTRIYAYQPDIPGNFSLPAFYGRGIHYNINLHKDFSRMFRHAGIHLRVTGWLNWGQTIYSNQASIGSGLDEIPGNKKSQLKAQILIRWQ